MWFFCNIEMKVKLSDMYFSLEEWQGCSPKSGWANGLTDRNK